MASGKRKSDIKDFLEDGHVPPQALDVEEAVLGAMLLEPNCVDEALDQLNDSCFYSEQHREIFSAMVELVGEHQPVDIITVANKLRQRGKLEEVGGAQMLASLSGKIGSAAHIESYTRLLSQKAIQRDLIVAAHEILRDAYSEETNVETLIDSAQSKVYAATQSSDRQSVKDIGSVIQEALQRLEKQQTQTGLGGVPSGFASLDKITNGWQPSDLIILAARPSVGKTAFSLNLARNAAVDHHIPTAFFSLEMSSIQLANRLMVSESGLSADKIRGGVKLQDDEWNLLEQSLKNLGKAPLYIDETPSLPIMEFRSKLKSLVKQKGVKFAIVDYLQLMKGPVESQGVREQEVAAISRMLKATAKELNIPIIALSQLSRKAVDRQGGSGKPVLSDLRESGSIEQDADMVILLYRPAVYDEEADNTSQAIIAKHRHGPTGTVMLAWQGEYTRFMNLATEY